MEKDGDVDTAHTEVYVNSQPAPKLWIDKQQHLFDPFQDIFVPAQVTGGDWSRVCHAQFVISVLLYFCPTSYSTAANLGLVDVEDK